MILTHYGREDPDKLEYVDPFKLHKMTAEEREEHQLQFMKTPMVLINGEVGDVD
jgi:hypothetical protein